LGGDLDSSEWGYINLSDLTGTPRLNIDHHFEEQSIERRLCIRFTFVAATGDNAESVEMRYQDDNIWLTQKMMAALYDLSVQNIGQHIKKIIDDGELSPDLVIKKYFITAAEIIINRANAEKEYMGLSTWEAAPHGKIIKADVSIAKN